MRSYKELIKMETFEERFQYLKLNGYVGEETFGFDRYLNQVFYHSAEWKRIRRDVIVRDGGCDLGIQDEPIAGRILIHHMNPISVSDIVGKTDLLLNPDYLICVSRDTHNAIHYGDEKIFESRKPITRTPNDTCPWK